jgi:uncharacterized membrane protein YcfT
VALEHDERDLRDPSVSAIFICCRRGARRYHVRHMQRTLEPARVDWVDTAKGICIVFVVMFHVNDLVVERMGNGGWLDHVVAFAHPFRMPDFFLIAGLFLASSMRRPWRSYIDTKVIHFLYFYAAWATLSFVVFDLRHSVGASAATVEYAGRFLDPRGPLWFIHILPIFFVLTRVIRRAPAWLVLLVAAGLHVLPIETGWHVPDQLASRYVFFYSGYLFASHVFELATWVRERAPFALGYLCIWGVANGILVATEVADTPAASLLLGYAGALAVIVAAVMLFEWRTLRYLGENSIVVYLGDALFSTVVVKVMPFGGGDAGFPALAATAATIVISVLAWQAAIRTPAAFMYRRPAWTYLIKPPHVARSPIVLGAPARSTITSR